MRKSLIASRRLSSDEITRLKAEIDAHGVMPVASALRVSRHATLQAVAGLEMRRGVLARIRAKLREVT
jgi:hypothetical protein